MFNQEERNEMATARVENSLELDDGNDEEEPFLVDPPPLSSYVTDGKFWCAFAIYPLIFIYTNVVVIASWLEFDVYEYEYSKSRWSSHSSTDIRIELYRTNSFAMAWILLANTALLMKATHLLEKDMDELNEEEDGGDIPTSDDANTTHVYAKVSRKLDKFFGQNRRPTHSILVSLLYVAAVSCCAGSIAFGGLYFYFGTSSAEEHCSRYQNTKHNVKMIGIPEELQNWARSVENSPRIWNGNLITDAERHAFIHMSDRRTFFVGKDMRNGYADEESPGMSTALVSVSNDNHLRVHSDVFSPRLFISVQGKGNEESDLFCCFYETRPGDQNDGDLLSLRPLSVLCVVKGEDISKGFRNISLSENSRHSSRWYLSFHWESATASNGTFWFAKIRQYRRIQHWEFNSLDYAIEFYSLDPSSMMLKSVLNTTEQFINESGVPSAFGFGSSCMMRVTGVFATLIMAMILPCCYWLIIKKTMTIGIVPLTISISLVLVSFSKKWGSKICLGVIIATSLLLLLRTPPSFLREYVSLIHYSIFSLFFIFDELEAILVFVVGCLAGIILNHPVMEVVGWVGVAVVAMILPYQLLPSGDGKHQLETIGEENFSAERLLLIPFSLILMFGLISIGRVTRKYRAYVKYYSRQLWYSIRMAERSSRGSRSRSRDENELTRRLVD